MIKETILVVIVIRTMKIQNNSKTRHKEKNYNNKGFHIRKSDNKNNGSSK